MLGRNIIKINHATMIEAMQYYLDNVMLREGCMVRVESVRMDQDSSGIFSISVASVDDEDEAEG